MVFIKAAINIFDRYSNMNINVSTDVLILGYIMDRHYFRKLPITNIPNNIIAVDDRKSNKSESNKSKNSTKYLKVNRSNP